LDVRALQNRREELQSAILASAVSTQQILPSTEELVREVGRVLFGALLGSGEVAGQYRASAALAASREQALRVVLRVDTPELAALPWEAMYDHAAGYVCRHEQLVRHIPVLSPPAPLAVTLPLRILAVVFSPCGLPALDVEKERGRLTEALAWPVAEGLVEVHWTPSATWTGLHHELIRGQWHIFHFIGHGYFDPDQDEGILALTRQDGRADYVEASRFADLLRQARPMPRLVVLNSCSGAAASASDIFAGTGAALLRGGVPAVTAMQYEITDAAGAEFADGFYTAVAHGRGVDDAVSSGRIAILGASSRTLEWLSPVLYLRGHHTHLFNLATSPSTATRASRETAPDALAVRSEDGAVQAAQPAAPPANPSQRPHYRVLAGHQGSVSGVVFSPDGALVATVGRDGTARVWDVAAGAMVRVLTASQGPLYGVAFSPDGTLVATAGADGTARVWDVAADTMVGVLSGHQGPVMGAAFSPAGALAATAGADGTARLWDVAAGAVVRVFSGHQRPVDGVAFSPDGALVGTVGTDKTARLWDVATGAVVRVRSGHQGPVGGLAFSPDGTLMATASSDKTARLWAL
jgi:hypothetical protein